MIGTPKNYIPGLTCVNSRSELPPYSYGGFLILSWRARSTNKVRKLAIRTSHLASSFTRSREFMRRRRASTGSGTPSRRGGVRQLHGPGPPGLQKARERLNREETGLRIFLYFDWDLRAYTIQCLSDRSDGRGWVNGGALPLLPRA